MIGSGQCLWPSGYNVWKETLMAVRFFFGNPTYLCPSFHFAQDFLSDFGQIASLYLNLSVKPQACEDNEDAMAIEGFL